MAPTPMTEPENHALFRTVVGGSYPAVESPVKPTASGTTPEPARNVEAGVKQSSASHAARIVAEDSLASEPSGRRGGLTAEELEAFLVNFVVEQTGYPPEIVELDADLEADLGIDSIKKAQLFGELREHFDIKPSETLSLDDFPTLAHVRDYLQASTGAGTSAAGESVPAGTPLVGAPDSAGTRQHAEDVWRSESVEVSARPENGSHAAAGPPHPLLSQSSTSAGPVISATAPSAGSGLSRAELEAFLVNFVVEQTGYPPEIVELDADLEADLGIDSIKKAQLFGELREHFDITPSETLSLDDFPTLAHVRDYLESAPGPAELNRPGESHAASESVAASAHFSLPDSSSASEPVAASAHFGLPDSSSASEPVAAHVPATHAAGGTGLGRDELEAFLVNFVVEQTGYPPEIVDLDADLEADLGIDSIKKAQLFGELREHFDITPSENLSLDDFPTLAHVRDYLILAAAR